MRTARRVGMPSLLLLLAAGSCASGGSRTSSPWAAGDGTAATVAVRNENWSDVRVYALCSGVRRRLGTVPSMTTATLEVPEIALGADGGLRFLLDPVGGGDEHVTPRLTVWSGGTIDLQVRNRIALSVASVR